MDGAEKQNRLAKILILIFFNHFYGERNQIVTAVDFTIKVKPGLQDGKGNSSGSEIQSEQMLDSSKNMYQTRQDYNEKNQLLNTPFSIHDKKDHETIITPKVTDEPSSNTDDKLNDNDLDEINNKDKATDEARSFNLINTSFSKNNTARVNSSSKQNTISENKRKQKRCAKNKINNSILRQKPIKLGERVMAPATPSCCQSLSRIYGETLNLQKQCKCSDSVNTIHPTENEQLGARINNNIVKMPNNQNNIDMNNFLEYNNQVKNMISELKTREREYEAVMTDNYNDKYDTNDKFINQKILSERKLKETVINNKKNTDEKKFYPHSFQGVEIYKKLSNDETNNKEINWQEKKLLDELNSRIRETPKDNKNSLIKLSDDESSSIESTPITFDDNAIMGKNIPIHYDSKEESSDEKLRLNEVKTLQEPINNNFLPKINQIVSEKKKELIEITTFKAMLNDKNNFFLESNTKRITEEASSRKGIILLDENPESTENDSEDSNQGIKPDLLERTNLNKLNNSNKVSSVENSSDIENKLESYDKFNDEFSQNNETRLEKTNFISNNYSSIKNTENDNSLIRSDKQNSVYYHDNEKSFVDDNAQPNQSTKNPQSSTEKEDSNYNDPKTSIPVDQTFEILLNNDDKNVTLKSNPPLFISANLINNKSNVNSNNIPDKISSKNQVETFENSSLVSSVEYTTIPFIASTEQNDYNGFRTYEITQGSRAPIYLGEMIEDKISSIEREHSTTRNTENFKNISPLIESNEISENYKVGKMNKNDGQEIDNTSNEENSMNNSDTFLKKEMNEPQENTSLEPNFTIDNNQVSNLIYQRGDKLQKTIINPDDETLKKANINSITTENVMYDTSPISRGIPHANDSQEIENLSRHQTPVKFYNIAKTGLLEEKIFENSVETTSSNPNLNDIKSINDKESQLPRIDLVSNNLKSSLHRANSLQHKFDNSTQNNAYSQFSSTLYPWSKKSDEGLSTVILNADEIIEHNINNNNNTENNLLAEANEKTMQNEKSKIKLLKEQQTAHTESYSFTETIADRSLPSSYYTSWGTKSTENNMISELKRAYPTTEISLGHIETESVETSKLNDKTNENILSRTQENENYPNKKTTKEHYEFQPADYEKHQSGGTFPDIEIMSKSSAVISTNNDTENEENSRTTVVPHYKTGKHGSDSDNNTIKDNSKIVTSIENFEVNNENEPKTNTIVMEPKELVEKELNNSSDNYPSIYNYRSNPQESINMTEEVINLQRKKFEITTEMSMSSVDITENTNDILQKRTFTESSSIGYKKISDDSMYFTTVTSQIPNNVGFTRTNNTHNNIHVNTNPDKNLVVENDPIIDNEELQVSTDGFQKESSHKGQLLEFTNSGSMQTTHPNYDSFTVKENDNRLETKHNYSAVTELTQYTTSLKDADYTTAHSEASSLENYMIAEKFNNFISDKEFSNTSKTHTPKDIEFTHDTSVTADQFDKITDSKATNYNTSNNISNVLVDTSILNSGNYKDENNDEFENSLHSIKNITTGKVSEDSQNNTSGYKAHPMDENNFINNPFAENFKNATTTESIGYEVYSENSSTETEMKDKFFKDTESNVTLLRVLPSDENKLDEFTEHYGNITSDELIRIQLPFENPVDSTVATTLKKVSEESESTFSIPRVFPSNENKTILLTEDYNTGTSEESTSNQLSSTNSSVSNEVVTADKFSEDIENNISLPRILPSDDSKVDSSSEHYAYDTTHESTGVQQLSENPFDSSKIKIFSEELVNNTSLQTVLPSNENITNSTGYANSISKESVGNQQFLENLSDPTKTAMTNKFHKDLENSTSPPALLQTEEKPNIFTEIYANKFLNEPMGIQISSNNPLGSTITFTTATLSEKLENNTPSPRIFSADANNNHRKTNLPTKQNADDSLDIQIPYEEINNVLDITGDYEISDGHSKNEKVPETIEQRKAKDNTYDNIYTADENTLDDTLNKFQETHILSTSTISYFDNEYKISEPIPSKSNNSKYRYDNYGYRHDEGEVNSAKDLDKHLFIQKSTEKTGLMDKNAENKTKELLFDSFISADGKNQPPGKQKLALHSLKKTEVTAPIKITESEIDPINGNNEQNSSSEDYTAIWSYPMTFKKTEMNPRVEEVLHPEKVSDSDYLKEKIIESTTTEDTKAIKIHESELNARNSYNDMKSTSENYEPTLAYPLTFKNTEVNPEVEEILYPEKGSEFDHIKEKNEKITELTTEVTTVVKITESEIKAKNNNNDMNSTSENYESTKSYPMAFQNTEVNPELKEILHSGKGSDLDYLKEQNENFTELSELNEREYTTNITPLKNDNLNLTNNKEYFLKLDLTTTTLSPSSSPFYLQEKTLSNENNANRLNLLQPPEVEFDQTPSRNVLTSPLREKGIIDDLKEGIPVILSLPVLILIKNASLLQSPQSKFFIENNGEKIEIDVKKNYSPSEISITPYQTDLEDDNNQLKRLQRQNMIEGNNEKLNEKNLSKSVNYNDNKNQKIMMNYNKIDLLKENNQPFKIDEENIIGKKYPLIEKLLSPQMKQSINDKLKILFDRKEHMKSEHDNITPDSNIIDVVYTSLKRLKKLFNDN